MNDKSNKSSAFFTPSGCLTGDALKQYISGSLSGVELEMAKQHISECPLCADAAEGLSMWLKENSFQSTSENQFNNRTALLNRHINERLHARKLHLPKETKRLSYKPFVWLAAAASILLFIGVGYIFWLQNQQNSKLEAQKLLRARDSALLAQIPENLAYPPSNSKVILNIKYNYEKGTHSPPVLTIVNDDVADASYKALNSGNKAGRTIDENEYTENRHGVESDVLRDDPGMYKGQNAKHTLTVKNNGGAMKRDENDDEISSVFISVQQMPSFPGGETARKKYLAKNLRYPTQAVEDGIQGTVYVNFVVKTNGSLADIKILRGIGGGCDEEALRVVKKMPAWYPGYQNGRNVPVRFTLKMDFKIK